MYHTYFLVCHLDFSPLIIVDDRLNMKCYSLLVIYSLFIMFITISLSLFSAGVSRLSLYRNAPFSPLVHFGYKSNEYY